MSTSPFQTPYRGLEPSWLDYNGHLNMAYYNVLFDQAIDLLFAQLGCGEIYRVEENMSFFTAEAHVCPVAAYQHEWTKSDFNACGTFSKND